MLGSGVLEVDFEGRVMLRRGSRARGVCAGLRVKPRTRVHARYLNFPHVRVCWICERILF